MTHRYFLLGDDADGVLAAHTDRRDPRGLDRLERVLCADDTTSARIRRARIEGPDSPDLYDAGKGGKS